MGTIRDAINQVRAEYLKTPGLRLQAEQVHRLGGIDRTISQMVLDTLVNEQFLCVTPDGRYIRSAAAYSSGRSPWAFVSEWGIPPAQAVQSDDPRSARDMLTFRQPERRRYRSDAELRTERAESEQQWNRWHPAVTAESGVRRTKV
jgi:hypothetical protein